ncbi:hypothetical protein CW735_07115 [Alteromonas sp. MB-3u-76]|uniref:hypothetical protein n=1 Tax=unclassified Alteromonas TaxID=2614992 RepID=UPI00090324F7|nr:MULTISPECIES: hypothetical protein [unclassified Alteromonas]APE06405.1 hypothetical protein BM528_11995 [Alteromonas sp. RW2A1]AUC87982.1 hypothetical protein CW735_07115 [Alteromonas sp. MB-3u-76]
MSAQSQNPDNIYTQQVKHLLSLVYPQESGFGSIFEDARHYFSLSTTLEQHTADLKAQLLKLKDRKDKEVLAGQLTQQIKNNTQKLEEERLARLERLETVCSKIISLCEGETWAETQQLSAKFLGTLMLLTRGADGNFARVHQRYKPIYKAVLTLRLADRLLAHDTIAHSYLSKYREAIARFRNDQYWKDKWKTELGIPLISAALLQDIGLQSSAALTILKGPDGDLDEFRLLDESQRKDLLKINYHFTMKYLADGLGIPKYTGNVKDERDRFIKVHSDASSFLQQLVKDAFLSKTGLGELVKIPQIYVSIVLSTKSDYTRLDLPKGYLLIEQLAKKGSLNKHLAQDFTNLVGYFPQGFGITFIPTNEKGQEKNQYEYAIVVGLNPAKPAEPICKVVTRNQKFVTSGAQEVIDKSRNLYFPANRKKLMRLGEARLGEIMAQLSNNFTQNSLDELVPSFWEPHDFFGFKKHQNLWTKNN